MTRPMRTNDEAEALAQVAGRLRERFPQVGEDDIRDVVMTCYHGHDGHPIRDFIPVLVENEARSRLARTT